MTSVIIPNSVTSIGSDAFYYCTSLTIAVFMGNAPTMGSSVFGFNASGFTVGYYSGATGFTSPTWKDSSGDTYASDNLGSLPGTDATDTPAMPPLGIGIMALVMVFVGARYLPIYREA